MMLSRMNVVTTCGLLIFCAIPSFVIAQSVETQPARIVITAPQIEAITAALQSHNAEGIDSALRQIKSWIPSGSAPSRELSKVWMPALMEAERFQDVADMALDFVLVAPSTSNIRDVFPFRITALQKLNREEEALQAAKSLYNGYDLKNIDRVIAIISQCLERCHPDDKTIGRRFIVEQAESSGTSRSSHQGLSTLRKIVIDRRPYEKAIAKWELTSHKSDRDTEKYANVLLLSDDGAKAEVLFRKIVTTAGSPEEKQRFSDGIVRALKCQDGNLTRAKGFETSQQRDLP